jgi:multiple RNA-binding domain-containing protein 1
MEGDEILDTRVFVSGLPPNLTSDQLGAHFAMRYQITDAAVVPGRRIGFVGFRNYTLARNAVKYFDKSYIRMSKISVEIAKPVSRHFHPIVFTLPPQTDVWKHRSR